MRFNLLTALLFVFSQLMGQTSVDSSKHFDFPIAANTPYKISTSKGQCVFGWHNPYDYAQYVNPMVGTGGHGHTFPGAVVPFGMVQLSPDTRQGGWDGCSGYHYSDKKIYGFSHTHLSGTGCWDLGDVMMMPTMGRPQLNKNKYASSFSHANECASPGFYSVVLDKGNIGVELTTTKRTGLHKYIFTKGGKANVILDLNHRDRLKAGYVSINGDNEITGMRLSSMWADSQYVYFVIRFSKPFRTSGIKKNGLLKKYEANGKWAKNNVIVNWGNFEQLGRYEHGRFQSNPRRAWGRHLKAYVNFDVNPGDTIYAKVGISMVSVEGAIKNLEAEQAGWDFDKVKQDARNEWNSSLGKIEIESSDTNVLRNFYTCLYHVFIPPLLNSDVDSNYRGSDFNIHKATNFNYYTGCSLWDTYRAVHPLLTLIDRKTTADVVNSFLAKYQQRGLLPVWDLYSNEVWGMIGYHSVSVINDAYQKGIRGFDTAEALQAMKHSATISSKALWKYFKYGPIVTMGSFFRYAIGWKDYQQRGYMRCRRAIESVSKTLEFSYDDWCIAQMAKKMGQVDDYNFFIKRSLNYKNILDSVTGFIRPRQKHFIKPFNPYAVTLHYTEANAWQYSFYVPHDLTGQMNGIGGKQRLVAMLDSLFNTTKKATGLPHHDMTGLIGQYAHGNEPSHQIAYEYCYVNQPWKTQAMVRRIMNEMYRPQPDGLSGNEDCGQMSAWYVFSALGFYPVCPGSNQYAIGSPLVDKAVIHFENGESFTITVAGNAANNVYVNSATLNNSPYSKCYINYEDLIKGGALNFTMGAAPNKKWGSGVSDVPVTEVKP